MCKCLSESESEIRVSAGVGARDFAKRIDETMKYNERLNKHVTRGYNIVGDDSLQTGQGQKGAFYGQYAPTKNNR